MNSKYRLLSTFVQKRFASSNTYVCKSGKRYIQSRPRNVHIMKVSPQSLIANLNLTTRCGCYARSCNAPVLSSSVISRYYASTPPDNTMPPTGNEQTEKKPSLYQRFKIMYRDYWYVLLPVHLVTSATWFGGFYYMASSGVDIVSLLEQLSVSEKLINQLRNGHATTGYLAISYALYKIATPLRYTITLGGTTLAINYLRKWGYIKPMPSKEKLKEIYEGKKEILKGRGQTLKDNMMQSFKPTENISSKSIFYEGLFKNVLWKSEFKMLSLKAVITRFYSTSKENDKPISQQLKDMFRKYWYVLVPVHLVTSVLWWLVLYYVAVSGIDLAEIMERLKFNEDWIRPFRRHKNAEHLAVAYTLYHLIAPLRYAVTLGGASMLKNYLKKRGVIMSHSKKNEP